MKEFNQQKYVNEYTKNNYDTIRALVPKGQKVIITEHYKKCGYESMSSYINDLIKKDMGAGT